MQGTGDPSPCPSKLNSREFERWSDLYGHARVRGTKPRGVFFFFSVLARILDGFLLVLYSVGGPSSDAPFFILVPTAVDHQSAVETPGINV